jgi:RNA polymerase sigma-32 factor
MAKKISKTKNKPRTKPAATSKVTLVEKTKAPVKTKPTRQKVTAEKTATSAKKTIKTTPKTLATSSRPKTESSSRAAVSVKAEIVESARATTAPALTPLGDTLSVYLANVNKYPLLTREQETQIAERYFKNHDPKDAEILVTANLRFVVKVAAEYSKFGNKLIDLIQEGNVGLMHAVKEFNPYKGVRLISYAVWWIRGYIQEYLMRQHSMVRIGTTQNQRKLFYHLQKEKDQLDMLGQEPSVQLLSTRLGIPENEIRMMEERMSGRDMSLDAPVSDDGSAVRLDFEASDEEAIDDQLARQENIHLLEEKLDRLRPQLNEKELYILEKRLLADDPITLQDIGTEWGVTREAVRQMEARVMKKIKDEMLESE